MGRHHWGGLLSKSPQSLERAYHTSPPGPARSPMRAATYIHSMLRAMHWKTAKRWREGVALAPWNTPAASCTVRTREAAPGTPGTRPHGRWLAFRLLRLLQLQLG